MTSCDINSAWTVPLKGDSGETDIAAFYLITAFRYVEFKTETKTQSFKMKIVKILDFLSGLRYVFNTSHGKKTAWLLFIRHGCL